MLENKKYIEDILGTKIDNMTNSELIDLLKLIVYFIKPRIYLKLTK